MAVKTMWLLLSCVMLCLSTVLLGFSESPPPTHVLSALRTRPSRGLSTSFVPLPRALQGDAPVGDPWAWFFTPNNIMLPLPQAEYQLDVSDSSYASDPVILRLPASLNGDVILEVRAQVIRSASTPHNPTVASAVSATSSKSPQIYLNSTPTEADVILGSDVGIENVLTASLIHKDGRILNQMSFTVFDNVLAVFDTLIHAPGSQGPWVWADVFPYNGQNFMDVHLKHDRSVGLRVDQLTEPFAPAEADAKPPTSFLQYQIDSNTTFIGLFKSFFGDQFKVAATETAASLTTGGTDEPDNASTVVLFKKKIPGGTSFGGPPWNLSSLFTQGRITRIDNADEQFRKGQAGEITVDNANEIPIY